MTRMRLPAFTIFATLALLPSLLSGQRGTRLVEPVLSARHILLVWKGHPLAPAGTKLTKEDAEAKAKELVAQLRAKEKSFAELAKKWSICPSKYDGGYLGQFRPSEFQKSFANAVLKAKPGRVQGPVESNLGFHVFERLAIKKEWPKLVSVQHILVPYKGAYRAAKSVTRSRDEALARAEMAYASIKTEKLSFAGAARKYSEDRYSSARGGALGTMPPANLLVPSFVDQLVAMKVGELKGPIETAFGFHVVMRLKVDLPLRASHILLPFKGSSRAGKITRSEDETRDLAKEILGRLEAGESFSALAAKYSTCPTAKTGGDLGEFSGGEFDPAFENAVRKAKVGQVVGPVKTRFGLHLILRTQ